MSARDPYPAPAAADSSGSSLVRAAIWVAIGALIAAAIVCVIWVLIGTQNGIIGRAFLTILLLAAFAGVAIIDAQLAPRRPAWFALASMVTWVITLLIGAVMIWMPERSSWSGFNRFVQFLLIVLILQLALLHIRLYTKAFFRHVTTFTQIVAIVTITLVIGLALMLVLPLMFGEWVDFADLYWRFVVAITILAAVGTALIPLVNALFAPKKLRPAHLNAPPMATAPMMTAPMTTAPLPPWPTYADGVTPLPMMPDGSPDWNAYYTGYPSTISQAIAPVAPFAPPSAPPQQAPVPRGYEGFPPPPPLPPRP